MKSKSIILIFLCLFSLPVLGATDSGIWLSPKASFKINDKWSVAAANELRYFHDFSDFNQVLFQINTSYKFSKPFTLILSGIYMATNRSTLQDEFRPTQAIRFKKEFGINQIALQQKIEERYYPGFNKKFSLRSRSLIQYSRSFTSSKKTSFIISEEFFLSSHDTDWGSQKFLDQNRLKVGIKYNAFEHLAFTISYLNQHIFRKNADDNNVSLIVLQSLFHI